jgi:preprotein translocase subunit YajC
VIHPSWYAFLAPPPGGSGSGATVVVVVQIAALLAIFYFLLIRPQRQQAKQHADMLKALKKGDEIVTTGGIIGRVVHLKDDRMTIESGESRLVIERERVAKVLTAPVAAEPAAK